MSESESFGPLIAVIDFHHARGPEIEFWLGQNDVTDPTEGNDWSLLPFMALSDGAHTSTEDFSYFTLKKAGLGTRAGTSLFGISCARQLDVKELKYRSADITRSTVQKAVAVITDEPYRFGQIRESLSIVTSAWFAQGDFSDIEILKTFQESLVSNAYCSAADRNTFVGQSLREIIYTFKYQALVLFKCSLLQPKMLFFGSRCERLCMVQFAFVSLIPGLINSLQDCADPALNDYARTVSKATSLKSSDRSSLLSYMGLPLQLFGKGSFFGPYTPLQQLDILADHGTKSYLVGSTNSLLLQQKDKYSDILINLDDMTVNITSTSLRTALSLSPADRRWIDFLTQTVQDTWDPAHPDRPNTMGYAGSEEFIRAQFEEYLLALLSSVSYQNHLGSQRASSVSQQPSPALAAEVDPSHEFNLDFIQAWQETSNYGLFSQLTNGSTLFDIVEPKHPTAGGLSVEDVQRRLAQQVAELHLDERVREGRESLGKHLAIGKERVGQFSNKIWTDIEAMREAQRKKAAERDAGSGEEGRRASLNGQTDGGGSEVNGQPIQGGRAYAWPNRAQAPDLTQMQASARDASAKAGAYLSTWSSWARDKGKEWQEKKPIVGGSDSPPRSPIRSPARLGGADEKGPSALSPTGSEHSGMGRSSAEVLGDKARRWSQILRKSKDGSGVSDKDDSTTL